MAKHFRTQEHDVWLPYKFAVGPVFERFYEGLKEEKLLGNKCPECGKVLVPARTFCPDCYVDMGEWVEVAQQGEIVTWAVANYEFFGMPLDPPFIGALIRIDGTSCNFLHLVGGFDLTDKDLVAKKMKPGVKVRAVWSDEKRGQMLDIKYFEPM
jgi:uncharacterized OB-fold protein